MLFEPRLYKHCLWDFGQQYPYSSVFLRSEYILIFLSVLHLSKALFPSVDHAAWISCSPSEFCCDTLIPSSSFVCLIKIFVKTRSVICPLSVKPRKQLKPVKLVTEIVTKNIFFHQLTCHALFCVMLCLLCFVCSAPLISQNNYIVR